MKNVQVIDGAENCTYSIYAFEDELFRMIFPASGQNVAFIEDVVTQIDDDERFSEMLRAAWKRELKKSEVQGIHGTLFYELEFKKEFYPTLKECEMVTGLEPIQSSTKA